MNRRRLLTLLPAAAALNGCEEAPRPSGPRFPKVKKRILSTTHFTASLAETVGGDAVESRCFLPPGVTAHDFKPFAPDIAKFDTSDIVLVHGLDFESRWSIDLEALKTNGVTVATVTAAIPPDRILRPSGPGGPPDPGVWSDPDLAQLMVTAVESTLKAALPKLESYFADRAHRLRLAFQDTKAMGQRRLAVLQPPDLFLLTSHDTLQYFARAYGLEARALCPADGPVPDAIPADLADWIRAKKVRSIFREPDTNPSAFRDMFKALRVDTREIIHTRTLQAPGATALLDVSVYDLASAVPTWHYNTERIVATLEVD